MKERAKLMSLDGLPKFNDFHHGSSWDTGKSKPGPGDKAGAATYYWLFSAGGRAEIHTTAEQARPRGVMLSDGGWATSGSTMYRSLEELHAREGMRVRCKECGGWVLAVGEGLEKLEAAQLCWSCNECEKFIAQPRPANVVVIAGRVYSIGPEPKPGQSRSFLGMAGREFRLVRLQKDEQGQTYVRVNADTPIITHNLWAGMQIPECYRDRIPDTARFIGGAGEEKVGDIIYWNSSS